MAKALLRYGGDASQLLDVCRARIVFDAAEDLAACVRLVCGAGAAAARGRGPGRAVRVLRVRSSMGQGYEGQLTSGFRVGPCPVFSLPPTCLPNAAAGL